MIDGHYEKTLRLIEALRKHHGRAHGITGSILCPVCGGVVEYRVNGESISGKCHRPECLHWRNE